MSGMPEAPQNVGKGPRLWPRTWCSARLGIRQLKVCSLGDGSINIHLDVIGRRGTIQWHTWGLMYKACLRTKKLPKPLLTQTFGCTQTDLTWESAVLHANYMPGLRTLQLPLVSWRHIEAMQRNNIKPTGPRVMKSYCNMRLVQSGFERRDAWS